MWLSCDHHVTVMRSCDYHVSPCDYHEIITWLSCESMWLSCDHHVTVMWAHVTIMRSSCDYHVSPCDYHVIVSCSGIDSCMDNPQLIKTLVIRLLHVWVATGVLCLLCRGQIVALLGDTLGPKLPECMPIFVDRLRNEITRLTAVRALSQIARYMEAM